MTDKRKPDDNRNEERRILERYRDKSTEQPPESVDARILAAARDAVEAPPAPRPTWRPLAVAAVVLLSATLVLTMRPPGDEVTAPQRPASAERPEPAPAEASPEPEAARSRRAASAPVLDKVVVTGNRIPADAEDGVATVSGEALAQDAELERRMPAAEADAASAAPADTRTIAAIEAINAAWLAGETAEAQRLLDAFVEAHPDYPESKLRDALPEALIERWRRQ